MADEVLLERRDRVLVVSIDRPQVRNAIDEATANGIARAMELLDEDRSLSVGVLTGKGGTFCAGMDLRAFGAGERPTLPDRGFAGVTRRPPRKPLLAAVEGYALAGGFEVALACDLIVAAEDATFGLPEVRRGLIAAGGGLLRLPTRIPYHVAMEQALTGDTFGAARAHELGLVNRLTAPGEALTIAIELATRIAQNAPLALEATKQVIAGCGTSPTTEAFDRQAEIYGPVRASDDAAEGARAFVEKRRPVWRGT